MRQPQIGVARLRADILDPDAFKAMGVLIKESMNSSDANSLLRMVLRGDEVRRDSLRAELPEGRFAEFCASKLLIERGERIYSPFLTHLVEGFVIVTDPDGPKDKQGEFFLDPLCEAPQVAKLLIRRTTSRGLDMGCGCGVLSLVLSSFCEQVIGIDINPRAIEVSRFNSALNGVKNVTIVESDLFSALWEQQFDHVVFNSPTNEEGNCYRDLLEAGEPLLTRFFTNLASHLTPRGYCQINLAMNDYKESYFGDRLGTWIGADRNDLWWVAMVCQRRQLENDHVWKRAWATFCRGSCSSAEVDWPYKLLPMTVHPDDLSVVVLRLLENHELLNSGNQLTHLTWSDGVRYSAQNSTLSLWDVPLVQDLPKELLSSFRHNESLAFPTRRDLDFWIEQCLRKGLLHAR
jgi:methylase of polypeptide subunit release factors